MARTTHFARRLTCVLPVVVAFGSSTLADWATAIQANAGESDSAVSNSFADSVSLDEFPALLRRHVTSLVWAEHPPQHQLNRQTLTESLTLGRQFILNNQRAEGNFHYQYDFVRRWMDPNDSQVRQAGALWGVSLLFQYEPDAICRQGLDRGLDFFFRHSIPGPVEGSLLIQYPGDSECQTGCVALVALSIIEYLRAEKAGQVKLPDVDRKQLTSQLNAYLEFLKFLRLDNKHFSRSFRPSTNAKSPESSPYFDGEALLCLIKAARYVGHTDLVPLIEDSAMVLAKEYSVDAWLTNVDSPLTKGFFQWSCMAFWEYQDAGWRNAETLGDYVLTLAWWMIHTHKTLDRVRNTAYAYEGIIHAYRLAQSRGDEPAMADLACTIDEGLHKMTTWQVGGPLRSENLFLLAHPTSDRLAVGGVMNHRAEAPLRIDVTQHQMHAVLLALKYVYRADA